MEVGTFTDRAHSTLIRDRTGNIAAADTPRFAAANLVNLKGMSIREAGYDTLKSS